MTQPPDITQDVYIAGTDDDASSAFVLDSQLRQVVPKSRDRSADEGFAHFPDGFPLTTDSFGGLQIHPFCPLSPGSLKITDMGHWTILGMRRGHALCAFLYNMGFAGDGKTIKLQMLAYARQAFPELCKRHSI